MIRVVLTESQVTELTQRRRDAKTRPRTRDRLEMVRLANLGWTIPKIAQHFEMTESRVRHWIKTFLSDGFDGLKDRGGVGPKRRLTTAIVEQIREMTAQEGKTWTTVQINEWLLEQHGFRLNRRYLSDALNKNGLRYKRTTRTLQHKQDPEKVADRKADLETLKKGSMPD
jgi:transposase